MSTYVGGLPAAATEHGRPGVGRHAAAAGDAEPQAVLVADEGGVDGEGAGHQGLVPGGLLPLTGGPVHLPQTDARHRHCTPHLPDLYIHRQNGANKKQMPISCWYKSLAIQVKMHQNSRRTTILVFSPFSHD